MTENIDNEGLVLPSVVVEMLEELEQFSDEACRFDHHGGCQSHYYLNLAPGEVCPHYEAYTLLKNVESDDDMEVNDDTVPTTVRQLITDLAGEDECEVEVYDGDEVCTSHSWSGDVPLDECPNGNAQKFLENLPEAV